MCLACLQPPRVAHAVPPPAPPPAQPTHSLFAFFTALCDAYSRVLMPPKDLRQRLEKDAADRCARAGRAQGLRWGTAAGCSLCRCWRHGRTLICELTCLPACPPTCLPCSSLILERALRRLEWERVAAKEAGEKAAREEAEREAMLRCGGQGVGGRGQASFLSVPSLA